MTLPVDPRDAAPALVDPEIRIAPVGPTGLDTMRRLVPSARTLGAALALPLVLYVVLRPENYGLTPNALDPIFYTGYAINLDDLVHAVGGRWYFVSRWSAYLPTHVADAIAGPAAGRLLWRLLLAALILQTAWALGRRWNRNVAQQFLVGTLVLTMPIFVRAYFSDYVEYLVVALGVCLACACLRDRQTLWWAAWLGTLAGLIVVANPVAITMAALCVLTGLLVGHRTWRARALGAVVAGTAFVAVGLAGLVLFRAQYDIANVYKPSIDFIRSYKPTNDPWRSPQHRWLADFTWLYAPPVLLAGSWLVARRRRIALDRVEKAALALCGLEYATHWFDQFVRKGLSLELSLYWSFAYPTFASAMVVMVGRLTDGVRARVVIGLGLAWIALLLVGVPDPLRLPSGVWFALVGVAIIAAAVALASRSSAVAIAVIVALVGWTQIGAPEYVPTADTQINASPRYDLLFRRAGSDSEKVFHEAVWFEEQMDRVPDDARASFVVTGGWASPIVGVYAPHVTGHLVDLEPDLTHLTAQSIAFIKGGTHPVLVVFGPPDAVNRVVATFPTDIGLGTQTLDVTHRSALGYRLVAFAMPDASALPFTWRADALPVDHGRRVGNTAVVGPGDQPGVVTYGPYVRIEPGRYTATLRYSSSEPVGRRIGLFDVSTPTSDRLAQVELTGTAGAVREVSLTFDATDPDARHEFRSQWDGAGTMTVLDVTYDRA